MGAQFIELFAELIEASLLTAQGGGRWPSCFLLERSVHALVSAVLFRMTGLDEFRIDPESDPPDRETTQSSNGRGGEGHSIVGANDFGKSVLLEEAAKYGRPPCVRSTAAPGSR